MQDVIFKSVQRAKLSYAFDSLHQFISDHPNASTHDVQQEAARISDHADNILGLMNRDNLLWNRTARDIASLSMMSVCWNFAQQLRQRAPIWKPIRDAIKAGSLHPGDMDVIEKRARG
jgi:hypothetical protein